MDATLDQYKPNPSVTKAFEVNEKLPEVEMTFDLFKKLVLARKTQDLVFLAMGKMLKMMRDRKLYKHLDFETFSQFLASEEISFSREKAYLYIRTYELYVEKLLQNPDEIGKLGVARLQQLVPVIKDMSPEDAVEEIERVKSLPYGDFQRHIEERKNKSGRPNVYFSEEQNKWIVNYYENTTALVSMGKFEPQEAEVVK